MTLTGRHLRMARACLNWSQDEVAARAKVAAGTVKRMESRDGPVPARTDTLRRIIAIYEKAGIEFPGEDQAGVVMVRYRPPQNQNRRR